MTTVPARWLTALVLAVAASGLISGSAAAAAAPAPPHQITVFVAGDSTAATWPASTAPKAGWGQALPAFLNPYRVRVENKALSGASSKSFVEAGLLDEILVAIRPGDYLIISFGHNDEKTDDRHTDPATTFPQYLSLYVDGALDRGAHPVLVTPVERRRFDADGHAYFSHGAYPQAMRDLAQARNVALVDLTVLSEQLWEQLGVEGTKDYFLWLAAGENPNWPDGVSDNTHFQAHGAIELARIVVRALAAGCVLPPGTAYGLSRPVRDDALVWPESIAVAD
jgi:pectinesterase